MEYVEKLSDIVPAELFDVVMLAYPEEMQTFPAAIKHHHAEVGGYARHIFEVVEFAKKIYGMQQFDFSIESLIKVAFLHDIDKLERYCVDSEPPTGPQLKFARSLQIPIANKESKTSLSTKIDNKKNNLNKPIQYFAYRQGIPPADESARVMRICQDLKINITDVEMSAICCHHGGWSAAANMIATMTPMATILHCADLMSAKIMGV